MRSGNYVNIKHEIKSLQNYDANDVSNIFHIALSDRYSTFFCVCNHFRFLGNLFGFETGTKCILM